MGFCLCRGLAMVAIAFVIVPLVGHTPSAPAQNSTGTSQQASSQQSATGSQGSAAAGTTNADLQSDLNGINGSMNQASSDQTSANSVVNDSQQQVSIPQD